MKKALAVFCISLVLSACSPQNNSSSKSPETSNPTTTPTTATTLKDVPAINDNVSFPFDEVQTEKTETKPKVTNKLSDGEILKLNTKRCGYGQGLRLDENNRPYGALDFNKAFGKYDGVAIENEEKVIYLTFDQGYENGYTSKILDVLKEKNVKATFFIIADYEKRNPELVKRMIAEGHTIGNHSVHHYSMPNLDINTAKKEINDLHNKVKEVYGYEMYLFRPPMGEYSEQSLAITQACGYKSVFWSYAYADWDVNKQIEPSKALEKVTKAAHSGCIYLLHSVSSTNAAILSDFIDNMKKQGYTFSIPQ